MLSNFFSQFNEALDHLHFRFIDFTYKLMVEEKSLSEKTIDEVTKDDLITLFKAFFGKYKEAAIAKYQEIAEFVKLKAGVEWLIPVAVLLIIYFIRKKFRKPDVDELAGKENVAGLIKALKYRRSQTAVVEGPDEMYQESGPVKIRCSAATALGAIRNPEAIVPLVAALKYDPDKYVRMNAIRALGNFETSLTKKAVIWASKNDPDEFVQYLAEEIVEEKEWV